MKYLSGILLIFTTSFLWAIPGRLVDGKPQYAIATVGNVDVYTVAERAAEIARTGVTAVNHTPTAFEILVRDSELKFDNYSDFQACVTNKEHLEDKLDDVPPSKARKNKAKLDALKAANDAR